MESSQFQYFLRTDPSQIAFSLIPLTDFQEKYQEEELAAEKTHFQTYAERYEKRYKSKFPKIPQYFDNEEDQYLFCAGHFHGEVGYRSHLFLPLQLCIQGAIKQRQVKLFKYFQDRNAYVSSVELNLILDEDLPEMMEKDQSDTEIYRETTIKSFKMARKLMTRTHYDNVLFFIFRDRPKEEYERLIKLIPDKNMVDSYKKNIFNPKNTNIYCGQIAGGEKEKATKMCARSEVQDDELYGFVIVLFLLDDLEILKKRFEDFQRSEEYSFETLVIHAAIYCAEKCFSWLMKKYDPEVEERFEEYLLVSENIFDYRIPTLKIPRMIEVLEKWKDLPSLKLLQIYFQAFVGDPLLNPEEIEKDLFGIIGSILIGYDHRNMFLKLLKIRPNLRVLLSEINKKDFNKRLFWCLEHGVKITNIIDKLEDINSPIFSYPEYQKLLSYFRETGEHVLIAENNIPTPYLLSAFASFLNREITLHHALFLTFPPDISFGEYISYMKLSQLLYSKNVEYAEYLASAGPIKYLKPEESDIIFAIKWEKVDPEMKRIFLLLFPDYQFPKKEKKTSTK